MRTPVSRSSISISRGKIKIPRSVALMDRDLHQSQITQFVQLAENLGRSELPVMPIQPPVQFSLAQWQTPVTNQGGRGTCWAFAGAAALEASYHRRLGHPIKVSEEYIYHIGRIGRVEPAARTEYPCSLWDGQGCSNVVMMMAHDAICGQDMALPYVSDRAGQQAIARALGVSGDVTVISPRDADLFEFSDLRIPLLARMNARYRVADWALVPAVTVDAVKAVLLSGHEVVCDYSIGHTLLVIGFDDARGIFLAKNSWGGTQFTEIKYANDPTFGMMNGAAYIKSVVDPTYVQNHACWLGRWLLRINDVPFELFVRRHSPFEGYDGNSLGQAWSPLGDHAVTGQFSQDGMSVTLNVALSVMTALPRSPFERVRRDGTTTLNLQLNHADPYVVTGQANGAFTGPVEMTRFEHRYVALWQPGDGRAWRSFHGTPVANYQGQFDALAADGFRLIGVHGAAHGTGAEIVSIWQGQNQQGWWADHGLSGDDYQRSFDEHVAQNHRLLNVTGYAERGQARFASVWTKNDGRGWRARHGMDSADFQTAFNQNAAEGFALRQVSGYRVGIQRRFVAIWEDSPGEEFHARHGLTEAELLAAHALFTYSGRHMAWVSAWPDSGRLRYAAIWSPHVPQAELVLGMTADEYQFKFNQRAEAGQMLRCALSCETGL